MPSMPIQYQFPATPEDFESLCLRLYRKHWDVPDLKKFGRRGSNQSGGDLLGTDAKGHVCFIQCKRREWNRKLTEREIKTEIEAAKRLNLKIHRYAITTTAKSNTKLQTYITKKNAEHRETGLFTIELDSWDDINELLNQYPEIAAATCGPESSDGGSKNLVSIQQQGTINVAIVQQQVPSGQGATPSDTKSAGLHAEIDAAARYNTDGKPETALDLLNRLKTQQWDRADAREKYRILANIGHAHRLMGNYDDAANAFRQAKQFQPQDENARWAEALSYTLQNDLENAHRLSGQLMKDFPEFPRATAVWVGSAPSDISFSDIESAVPSSQRGDSEVALNLAFQGAHRREWRAAEEYARKALENDPKWTEARIALATFLFESQLAKRGDARFGALAPQDRSRIEECVSLLSLAIQELPPFASNSLKARHQVNLAGMHQLLGHDKEAGEIIAAAHLTAPDDSEVQRAYAGYLMDTGRLDEAVTLLRSIRVPSLGCVLLMAQVLALRKHDGDQEEAVKLLELNEKKLAQLKQEPVDMGIEWVRTILRLLLFRQGFDAVASLLAGKAADWLRPEEKLAWQADLAFARDDRTAALEKAKLAFGLVSGNTHPLVVRQLAIALHRLQSYAESLELWLKITPPDHVSMESDHLLACAQWTGREDVILDFCRRLRESGVFEPRYIQGELAVLEQASHIETLKLLGELLEAPVEETFKLELRAWRSYIAIQMDKTDLVDVAPEHLPSVANLKDARKGRVVVEVLRHGPDPIVAVRYAYELFRKFPNELDAHMAVVASVLGSKIDIPEPGLAKAGTAVMFKEDDSGQTMWVVIEDSPSPLPALCEQGSDTPIARALIGKSKGDACVLRDRPRRTGIVMDIVDKHVYRFRECISGMESRFSGSAPIISMHAPTKADGTPDAEKMLEQVKEVSGDTGKAEQVYQDKLVPLHMLGVHTGGSAFEAVQRLAGRDGMTIKCCVGARGERDAAFAAIKTASEIVLDASALGTLYLLRSCGVLDVGEFLKAAPYKYIVSEHTLMMLRQLRQFRFRADRDGLFLDVSGGGVSVHAVPADQMKRAKEDFEQFIRTLELTVTVAAGTSLVTKGEEDKKLKEAAEELLGKEQLDSAFLAAVPGRVLWTDDLAAATIVCPGLCVRRAWTQAVVFWLAERGFIAREQEQKVSNLLLRAGYVFTSLRPDHVTEAGNSVGWNVDAPELRPFLSYFGSPSLDLPSRFSLASGVLKNLWQRSDLQFKVQGVTFRILAALRTVREGQQVIDALIHHAGNIFGLDVMTAQAFRQAVRAWLQTNRGIVLP